MMKKYLTSLIVVFFFAGCGANNYRMISDIALSKDPLQTVKTIASQKAVYYAANPKQLERDIKAFLSSISKEWGEKNAKTPQPKEYVKYIQNYKSRASIDFDKGIVTVETVDEKNPLNSLKNAIVSTLLMPSDPRSVDLFDAKEVKLGATPYLLSEVVDDQKKSIRYSWRANRYADILIKNSLKTKYIDNNHKKIKVHFVDIAMVKDHADIRVAKYKPYVEKYAAIHGVSKNLVYAIIQTESNFNQYAVSNAGAYGLMQIVPSSAGKDALRYLGRNTTPSKEYLFNAKNNIELGVTYLKILSTRYLQGIQNDISNEYCTISAYNTGSGNVLRTFSKDRNKAKDIINSKTPSQVYNKLIEELPYHETRRYLKKVLGYKKDFVRL